MSCASASASASSAFRPRARASGAGDLGHFQGVGEAAAKVVGRGVGGQAGEDLRLAGQAAKGARVQDAGGVAGKGRAVGMRRLGVRAAGKVAARIPWCRDARRQRAGGLGRRSLIDAQLKNSAALQAAADIHRSGTEPVAKPIVLIDRPVVQD